jgi:hypothetical protein
MVVLRVGWRHALVSMVTAPTISSVHRDNTMRINVIADVAWLTNSPSLAC